MTTTLFMNGRSQAVRLPKQLRLPGKRAKIRRFGRGLLLEPMGDESWPEGYFEKVLIKDNSFKRPGQGEVPPLPDLER
ncbi:MAG: AbrB/MazE/SpoVT family DNA-binding domain-containing protein [Chthoniobacterales bacterium]|nr:AbrB/MazE/SpoVT family DNA-binding domain-containing protein [Chthoniobacterales bacterium]